MRIKWDEIWQGRSWRPAPTKSSVKDTHCCFYCYYPHWFYYPGEQVENDIFQVSISLVGSTQWTVPISMCPSGCLQEQEARNWKWEILERCFVAFRKWGWSFQKNLLILGRLECGREEVWMTIFEVCPWLRIAQATHWSLEERVMGQQNVVNMSTGVWSQAVRMQIPALPLTTYLPGLLWDLQ